MIEGVQVFPLLRIQDERGVVMQMLRVVTTTSLSSARSTFP